MTDRLKNIIEEVNTRVMAQLPDSTKYPSKLVEAMNYAMSAGGKRIRPVLLFLSYEMLRCVSNNDVLESSNEPDNDFKKNDILRDAFMGAIEMIHTHSLIHDDLPALDNDTLRRGKPTVHVAYNESTAILAGDALLNYAYELVSLKIRDLVDDTDFDPSLNQLTGAIRAQQVLSYETGIDGMLGGQALDVELSGSPATSEDRDYIYDHKTCALIKAPLKIGAYLAGCSGEIIDKLDRVGYLVGTAFQVQDDILDVIGDAEKLGKEVGQDSRNEKSTYVAEYGLESSREFVRKCSEDAISIIKDAVPESESRDLMIELISELINRDN